MHMLQHASRRCEACVFPPFPFPHYRHFAEPRGSLLSQGFRGAADAVRRQRYSPVLRQRALAPQGARRSGTARWPRSDGSPGAHRTRGAPRGRSGGVRSGGVRYATRKQRVCRSPPQQAATWRGRGRRRPHALVLGDTPRDQHSLSFQRSARVFEPRRRTGWGGGPEARPSHRLSPY